MTSTGNTIGLESYEFIVFIGESSLVGDGIALIASSIT